MAFFPIRVILVDKWTLLERKGVIVFQNFLLSLNLFILISEYIYIYIIYIHIYYIYIIYIYKYILTQIYIYIYIYIYPYRDIYIYIYIYIHIYIYKRQCSIVGKPLLCHTSSTMRATRVQYPMEVIPIDLPISSRC